MKKILIIDDDELVRHVTRTILAKHEYTPIEAQDGMEGIAIFKKEPPSAVLLDLKMPGMDGIQTLAELKKIDSDIPIIMVTAFADIPTAVQAIKMGAYDFLTKPPAIDALLISLTRAIENYELHKALTSLDTTLETSLEWVFGKSAAMKNVIRQIRQVSKSDFSVIIQGDTGTGKSVVAQTIHNLSRRAEKPFQSVDVGVIHENLIESELFGHEKGSFTGADRKRSGFFETANTGTLFIDELENIPLQLQSKLLRAVEEKRIYSIGSTKAIDVDVRIIAATNTDIKEAVRNKKFREDLFFRLSEFMITVPRLNERAEDIPFMAMKFLTKAGIELNKQMREIDSKAMELIQGYPWPGNVRELRNVIRRAVLLSNDGIIKASDLEFLSIETPGGTQTDDLLPLKKIAASATRDAERSAIKRTLAVTKGNKTKAATILQVDYKTLLTKIKDYGLGADRS